MRAAAFKKRPRLSFIGQRVSLRIDGGHPFAKPSVGLSKRLWPTANSSFSVLSK